LADDCLKTENFNSKSLSNSLDNICSYFNNSLFSLILEYIQIGKNQENALNFYLEKMQTFKKYSHKIFDAVCERKSAS
ncbi:hypothetical protein D0809_26240, partial [Flavobacterium circumlabens]